MKAECKNYIIVPHYTYYLQINLIQVLIQAFLWLNVIYTLLLLWKAITGSGETYFGQNDNGSVVFDSTYQFLAG